MNVIGTVTMRRRVDREFEAFVRRSYTSLLRTAQLMCPGDAAGAEDLVQASLLKTYMSWGQIQDPAKACAYVRVTMIRTLASRRRRRSSHERPTEELPDWRCAQNGHNQSDTRLDLIDALRSLPTRQRLAVVLRHYLDLSEAETAAELSCSIAAVKALNARGLAALKTKLKENANEEASRTAPPAR